MGLTPYLETSRHSNRVRLIVMRGPQRSPRPEPARAGRTRATERGTIHDTERAGARPMELVTQHLPDPGGPAPRAS